MGMNSEGDDGLSLDDDEELEEEGEGGVGGRSWPLMVAALLQILPALAVELINLQYYLMVQAMAVFG